MKNYVVRTGTGYSGFVLGSIGWESNPHGKGWHFALRLGRGAGYRWIDGPGYSMNIAAPWYRHLSISGRTFRILRKAKLSPRPPGRRTANKAWDVYFGKNANRPVYPAWW